MKNIVWQMPDGKIAVTAVLDETANTRSFAQRMREDGNVPSGFVPVLFDVQRFPDCDAEHWRFDEVKGLTDDSAAVLASAKANAFVRINAFAKSKRALIAGTPDDAEIAGWSNKLRIAQAIVAGSATNGDKAVFQAEITARGIAGETLDSFTQKVIKNATFFGQAVALIDGMKRKAQDAVSAAKTAAEVAAVLDAMKAQAEAAFAQLMQSA